MLLPAFKGVVTDDQPTEIAEEGQKTDGEEKPQEEKTESESGPPPEQPAEPPKAPEVDGSHPEVIAMVDEAIKEAEKQPVTLSPEVYVEILDKAIKEAEKEMREKNTEGPL
jgi:adenylate/nucleoside-diphosphate kinase